MKTSKIMLTVIVILAVVGGALAFKASHVGNTAYCYTTTINCLNNSVRCPKGIVTTFLPCATISSVKYTLTNNTINCTITPPTCTKVGRLTMQL
jgi:hypothetical protein